MLVRGSNIVLGRGNYLCKNRVLQCITHQYRKVICRCVMVIVMAAVNSNKMR